MVNINLYKRKKQKFKLTTVFFLICIFLLPVITFKISLWTWKNMEISTFRQRFPIASSFVSDSDMGNLSEVSKIIRNNEIKLSNNMIKLQAQTKTVESDIIYSYTISNYLAAFSNAHVKNSQQDKVFLKRLNLERNQAFEIEFYDIPYEGNNYAFFRELNRSFSTLPFNYSSRRAEINFLFLNALEAKTEIDIKGY